MQDGVNVRRFYGTGIISFLDHGAEAACPVHLQGGQIFLPPQAVLKAMPTGIGAQ